MPLPNRDTDGAPRSITRRPQQQRVLTKMAVRHGSEETNIELSSFQQAIQAHASRIAQSQTEQVPQAKPDKSGSDISWYTTTYQAVKNLYAIANREGQLKEDDKNDYLLQKFMQRDNQWIFQGNITTLFIDMMIAKIFSKIAQQQVLNQIAVNKLILTFDKLEELYLTAFSTNDIELIGKRIIEKSIYCEYFKDEPQFIATIARRLKTECINNFEDGYFSTSYTINLDRLRVILDEIFQQIRRDSLNAIYYAVKHNPHCLDEEGVEVVTNLLATSPDQVLVSKALKVLSFVSKHTNVDQTELLATNLRFLEAQDGDSSQKKKTAALCYLAEKARVAESCRQLMTREIIDYLINMMVNKKLKDSGHVLQATSVIMFYLQHEFTPALDATQLKSAVELLLQIDSGNLQLQILQVIRLSVEKNKCLPSQLIVELLENLKGLTESASNLVVVILAGLQDISAININLLAPKMLTNLVIVEEELSFQCEAVNQHNQHCRAVSTITAGILVRCVNEFVSAVDVTAETLHYLMMALSDGNKQTRIRVAKLLYMLTKKADNFVILDFEQVLLLQNYLHDNAIDISVYVTLAYIQSLHHYCEKVQPINALCLQTAAGLYAFSAVNLEKVHYADEINEKVLTILLAEAEKQCFAEVIFTLLNKVMRHDEIRLDQCLSILKRHIEKNYSQLPGATVVILEERLSDSNLYLSVLEILMSAIAAGQVVHEVTILTLSQLLYESHDTELRKRAYHHLCQAAQKQSLPNSVAITLEVMSIGSSLSQREDLSKLNEYLKNGVHLPLDLFPVILSMPCDALEKLMLFKKAADNEQFLPERVLAWISENFDSLSKTDDLIFLCLAMMRNQQQIPEKLMLELKKGVETQTMPNAIMLFFTAAQTDNTLPPTLLSHVLRTCHQITIGETQTLEPFFSERSQMMHTCITTLKNILTIRPDEAVAQTLLRLIFSCLPSATFLLKQLCIDSICLLKKYDLISRADYVQLFPMIINDNQHHAWQPFMALLTQQALPREDAPPSLLWPLVTVMALLTQQTVPREDASSLLWSLVTVLPRVTGMDDYDPNKGEPNRLWTYFSAADFAYGRALTRNETAIVTLFNINSVDDAEYLDACHHAAKRIGLLLPNYQRIEKILATKPGLYEKVMTLLADSANHIRIPTSLIETLKIIASSSGVDKTRKCAERIVRQHDPYFSVTFGKHSTLSPEVASRVERLHKVLSAKISFEGIDDGYLQHLLAKVVKQSKDEVTANILNHLERVESFLALQQLFDFINTNDVAPLRIVNTHNCSEMLQTLQIETLCTLLNEDEASSALESTRRKFKSLMQKGWSFAQIKQLIFLANVHLISGRRELFNVLTNLFDYQVDSSLFVQVEEIINQQSPQRWLSMVHQRIVAALFPHELVQIKSAEQICHEMYGPVDTQLLSQIAQIRSEALCSETCAIPTPIGNWQAADIRQWATTIRSNYNAEILLSSSFLVETLAVLRRANYLVTHYQLTTTQILSCLHALQDRNDCGRLMQVATGEGKTIIISCLAIIHGLLGYQVDVITSSPVRASEDAKSQAPFYQLFGLTVSDNIDRGVYLSGKKRCYEKDIVYGEVAQYQFDALRDSYHQLGTLAGRSKRIALVDEVDSMLVDDGAKIAKLSSTISGMDTLQPIYFFIWQRLNTLQEHVLEIDGALYLINGSLRTQDGTLNLFFQDKDGLKTIADLPRYIRSGGAINPIGEEIKGDCLDFFAQMLQHYVEQLIEQKQIVFPAYLNDFVQQQLPIWISNAIAALCEYHENIHYVIQDGVINPVAYDSNGVVQSSTSWSDGLHQFLQLKHQLSMTSETLTTNFLSNAQYFRSYGANLVGLTGTLGSTSARQLLKDVYHVDFQCIPRSHYNRYRTLSPILADNHSDWLATIITEVNNDVKKERGILIICESIAVVEEVAAHLTRSNLTINIKKYTLNDCAQERELERINPGEVIIATNLAGRGTDINADAIEAYGGMSVLLTFLPDNQRVEDQAFGRTSRGHRCGTGRMLLNRQNLPVAMTEVNIATLRDARECHRLDTFRRQSLVIIQVKDELFSRFSAFVSEVREDIRQQSGYQRKLMALFKFLPPDLLEQTIIAALEEPWAMFLRKIDDGTIAPEHAEEEYNKLEEILRQLYHSRQVFQNPFHLITLANYLLAQNAPNAARQALEYFNQAIAMDNVYSAAAHVGRAWCYLKTGQSPMHGISHKEAAIEAFTNALKMLSQEMGLLNSFMVLLSESSVTQDAALLQQLTTKVNLLGSYMNTVREAMNSVQRSQRLITVEQVGHYVDPKDSDSVMPSSAPEELKSFYGVQRDSAGNIPFQINASLTHRVVFSDLTVHQDNGTRDQAMVTLEKAFSEQYALSSRYTEISLELPDIDLAQIQNFLCPDICYVDLSLAEAIVKCNERLTLSQRYLSRFFSSEENTIVRINLNGKCIKDQKTTVAKAKALIEETSRDTDGEYMVALTFVDANTVVQHFKVTFDDVSVEQALTYVDDVVSKSITIECFDSHEAISALLDTIDTKLPLSSVHLGQHKETNSTYRSLNIASAKERLSKNSEKMISLKFVAIDAARAKAILSNCKQMSFAITFSEIDLSRCRQVFVAGGCTATFSQLSRDTTRMLISYLRKGQLNFRLVFDTLNPEQTAAIIRKADLAQENMTLTHQKFAQIIGNYHQKPEGELNELAARGIEYFLVVDEYPPIPWRSICTVGLLASVQMATGAALVTTGFGANVGMGLITEGATDLIVMGRAYSTRSFDWTSYAQQKAVSLVISSVSLGWQNMKDAGKGAANLLTKVQQEAIEQAGTQIVLNGRTISMTLRQSGQQLRTQAMRQIGFTIAETTAREGMNRLADNLTRFCFAQHRQTLLGSIETKLQTKFHQSHGDRQLCYLIAMDRLQGSQMNNQRLPAMIHDIFNPHHPEWRKHWDAIGWPLCRGILSAPQYLTSKFSIGVRLLGILQSMKEVTNVIDRFYDELSVKLNIVHQTSYKLPKLLQQQCEISNEVALAITQRLIEQGVVDESQLYFDLTREIDLGIYQQYLPQVRSLLVSIVDAMELASTLQILLSAASYITDHIIAVTDSAMVMPLASSITSTLTTSISNRLQDRLIRRELTAEMEALEHETGTLDDASPEAYNRRLAREHEIAERKELLQSSEHLTTRTMIGNTAKRYTIAHSQSSIAFFAHKTVAEYGGLQLDNDAINKVLTEYITGVESGTAATLYEMTLLARVNEVALKIVDDINYKPTAADGDKQIVVYTPGVKDDNGKLQEGHWLLMGADGNIKQVDSSNSNCGYAVMAHLTGKTVQQLRQQTTAVVQQAPAEFIQAAQAQLWLERAYPNEANRLLLRGGETAEWAKEWAKNLPFFEDTGHLYHAGSDKPGDKVVFINGINTTEKEARAHADNLSESMGRPVVLIYNATAVPRRGNDIKKIIGFLKDVKDAAHKKLDPTSGFYTHASKQLAACLAFNMYKDRKVTLVTHSDGNTVANNAFACLKYLGAGSLSDVVDTWLSAGSPVNKYNVSLRNHIRIDHPEDPVVQFATGRILRDALKVIFLQNKLDMSKHDFSKTYIRMIRERLEQSQNLSGPTVPVGTLNIPSGDNNVQYSPKLFGQPQGNSPVKEQKRNIIPGTLSIPSIYEFDP